MVKRFISLCGAGGCAWRALYLSLGGRQVAYLGLDPKGDRGPQVFGGLWRWSFRFTLPHVRWSHAYPARGVMMDLYMAQQRLLSGLDGRYGWGTRARKSVYR